MVGVRWLVAVAEDRSLGSIDISPGLLLSTTGLPCTTLTDVGSVRRRSVVFESEGGGGGEGRGMLPLLFTLLVLLIGRELGGDGNREIMRFRLSNEVGFLRVAGGNIAALPSPACIWENILMLPGSNVDELNPPDIISPFRFEPGTPA